MRGGEFKYFSKNVEHDFSNFFSRPKINFLNYPSHDPAGLSMPVIAFPGVFLITSVDPRLERSGPPCENLAPPISEWERRLI